LGQSDRHRAAPRAEIQRPTTIGWDLSLRSLEQQPGVAVGREDSGERGDAHGRPLSAERPRETPSARDLQARFDATTPFSVGLEEEVLLIATDGPDLVACGAEVVARAGRPNRVKEELPPCQVELATRPHLRVEAATAELTAMRSLLVDACAGLARPAAAAVHPHALTFDPGSRTGRHRQMLERFGWVAERQLVSSLQIHVALGDHKMALSVYNLLREHLPVLAALGAAAPFHASADTGMASVRPLLCGQLPRQGVPPILHSWDHYAQELAWGVGSGVVADVKQWWWELRPHPLTGTLEVRVLDAQPTVAAARSLAALTVAVVRMLADQVASGAAPEPVAGWRIEENRWSALRDGIGGTMVDLRSGGVRPTRLVAERLLEAAAPFGEPALFGAHALLDRNGATALREVGLPDALDWLCDIFA
jgi:carboxylate-amine ligase